MTEQSRETAREMIQQEVYEAYQAGIDHECVPFKYPPMGRDDIAEATDRIIAIVRSAMIAPSTITAAHKGVPPPCQIERVLTNALNEVFGE